MLSEDDMQKAQAYPGRYVEHFCHSISYAIGIQCNTLFPLYRIAVAKRSNENSAKHWTQHAYEGGHDRLFLKSLNRTTHGGAGILLKPKLSDIPLKSVPSCWQIYHSRSLSVLYPL